MKCCKRFVIAPFSVHRSLLFLFTIHASLFTASAQVRTGADLLFAEHRDLFEGKRVGVVTNHTGVLSNGVHLADTLGRTRSTNLVALFGPEHGIRGDAPDGLRQGDSLDAATGVPVYSLYGKVYKPTPEMLKNVDILVFDIQDIGARFYTYISTLSYSMEAAAEAGIPFVVLDRPNPTGGLKIEGFVREDSLRSFVGLHPIPIVHGMTIGELATLFNEEGWLSGGVKARLTVVRLKGWKRSMLYDETGLPWIQPSPNMRSLSTAIVYPGMCLVEGTNVSEGRGTSKPFETIGAPFVDGGILAGKLNDKHLPGVVFEAAVFTPEADPRSAPNAKHVGQTCGGVMVRVIKREVFEPVRTGVYLLSTLKALYPEDFQWRKSAIDRLAGTRSLREGIDAGKDPEALSREWRKPAARFLRLRAKYLLY